MRRSSSVRPCGSFHRAMSRVMLISCGIQWLAQVARYFSQAHLYLKGTSWLTSVLPLMMRLSTAETRRLWAAAAVTEGAACGAGAGIACACSCCRRGCGAWPEGRPADARGCEGVLTSSSQLSMAFPVLRLWKQCFKKKSIEALHGGDPLCVDLRSVASMRRMGGGWRRPHWQASQPGS